MSTLASNPRLLLTVLLLSGNISVSLAQGSLFSYENYISQEGDTLKYRQLFSDYDPVTKYPLVVFLHGSGERGDDNEAQLKWGVKNFVTDQNMKLHPAIVIAPQCPKNMSWANFKEGSMSLAASPSKTMGLLIDLIKESIKNLPIDTTRIYLTGLSMGGFGTFDAISRHPDLFAAAVPVCGGGDISKASTISHIPMWIFHGALDGAVDPTLSHKMVEALTVQGANPGFTQYPEVGHFSWIAAYSDPMMMEWLFRQKKQ